MKNLLCVVALAALLGSAHSALAQSADDVKRAGEEFSAGKSAYQDGDYAAAAEHFEAADDIAPNAGALRAAMASRNKAGQLDRAATLAEVALERHPDDSRLAGEALEILETARQELYRVVVSCNPKCSLVIEGSLVHGPPARERVIYLAPGSHEINASWQGKKGTSSQFVEAEMGGEGEVEIEPPAPAPEDAAAADAGNETDEEFDKYVEDEFRNDDFSSDTAEDKTKKKAKGLPPGVFVLGVGTTAVLGGVTIWSGIDTLNNPGKDEVTNNCEDTDCEQYQDGLHHQRRTNVLIGATSIVGAATIVIGVVGTNWKGKRRSVASRAGKPGRPTVGPWATVGRGAMVGARGRF